MVVSVFEVQRYQTTLFLTELPLNVNMKQRELPNSDNMMSAKGPLAVTGLPTFWDTAEVAPKTDWKE